jgi:hypothetical protein
MFRSCILFWSYIILTVSLLFGIGVSTVYALDDMSAVKIA